MHSFSTLSKPPVSSSVYIVPSQSPNMKKPTGKEQYASFYWRGSSSTEISIEKQHETFLADFDEKFSMSACKMATLPTKINGFCSPVDMSVDEDPRQGEEAYCSLPVGVIILGDYEGIIWTNEETGGLDEPKGSNVASAESHLREQKLLTY
nr:transmembrane protein 209 [Tanacetum cinerariifolium]